MPSFDSGDGGGGGDRKQDKEVHILTTSFELEEGREKCMPYQSFEMALSVSADESQCQT